LPPGVNSSLRDKAPKLKAQTYSTCGIKGATNVAEIIVAADGKWNEKSVEDRRATLLEFIRTEWG